jgi:hypothetical protein
MRNASDFDALIDQVTSGIVGVSGESNADGSVKFTVNKAAKDMMEALESDGALHEQKEREKVLAQRKEWANIEAFKNAEW